MSSRMLAAAECGACFPRRDPNLGRTQIPSPAAAPPTDLSLVTRSTPCAAPAAVHRRSADVAAEAD